MYRICWVCKSMFTYFETSIAADIVTKA
jgi:hypothetical protein